MFVSWDCWSAASTCHSEQFLSQIAITMQKLFIALRLSCSQLKYNINHTIVAQRESTAEEHTASNLEETTQPQLIYSEKWATLALTTTGLYSIGS